MANTNATDVPPNHVFLDGDVVAYMCDAEHFDFEDRMFLSVCSDGVWMPSVIANCTQHCKFNSPYHRFFSSCLGL